MGEPAMPTPADRAATRETAHAIIDSVVNDEDFIRAAGLHAVLPADAEMLVFELAQEITLLEERVRALEHEVQRLNTCDTCIDPATRHVCCSHCHRE